MAGREWGNPPLLSTTAPTQSNPSTATLCAELIIPIIGDTSVGNYYESRFSVGASTGALWRIDVATSSVLSTASLRTTPGNGAQQRINVFTGSNQNSEFVFTLFAKPGDRMRVTLESTVTATAAAAIEIEAYT